MNKITAVLLTLFSFSLTAQVQIGIPKAPKKIEFADVIVNLDESTQNEVNKEITSLLTPQNSFLDAKLERMQWYMPIIEKILEEEGVPDDIKYISIMESSLIPEALSTSGALGYWQLKEPTAKELGLEINRNVDERKNIHESTKAAALYFKRNNLIYKNWLSSIYAYYQGPTGAAANIPSNWSYATEVNFDSNTPNYLKRALAHRIAFEHRLNRLKASDKKFMEFETNGESLSEITAEFDVTENELKKYNAWILSSTIPDGKPYRVILPVQQSQIESLTSKMGLFKIRNKNAAAKRTNINTSSASILKDINGKKAILAGPGDEAAQLARQGEVKLANFLKYNDMSDTDLVKKGNTYYLEKKGRKAQVPFHTALEGQSAWDISQLYGVRLKKLLKYNRISQFEDLQPGRVMWLQKKRPRKQPVKIIKQKPKKKPTPPKKAVEPIVQDTETIAQTNPPKKVVIIEEEKKTPPQSTKTRERETYTTPVREEKPPAKVVYTQPRNTPKAAYSENNTHRVARGETLYSLARRYGLSVSELRRMNGMSSSDVLQYNQLLTVTSSGVSNNRSYTLEDSEYGEPSEPIGSGSTTFHNVRKGETLYSISRKYNMSVSQIKNLNNLRENTISIGQNLKVSGGGNIASQSTHIVKKGETLYSISKMYNTSVNNLKRVNNLRNNTISIGQSLNVR